MTRAAHAPTRRRTRRAGIARAFVEQAAARGRPEFTLKELVLETKLSPHGAWSQLRRLERARSVRRVTPRHGYYVIVPPEYREVGMSPAEWWLGAYFESIGERYYVALLSAAAHYGVTHQAPQETHVIVEKPRRSLRCGRIRLSFVVKRRMSTTPVTPLRTDYSTLMVSSPEATLLDLVRYAKRIGGIARAREVAAEIVRLCRSSRLAEVLERDHDIANAQRLGLVLETCGAERLAQVVERWLKPRRVLAIPLVPSGREIAVPENRRWRIFVNASLEASA